MAENTVVQIGEMLRGGLRHAMLWNDQEMLKNTLMEIGNQGHILRVAIFDTNGRLKFTSWLPCLLLDICLTSIIARIYAL